MSFYRTILAAVAAAALVSPVFADDTTNANTTTGTTMTTTENTTTTTTTTGEKVNINKATAKELMQVNGLNASKARKIVAYRKKHGEFKSTEEITKIKGLTKLNQDTLNQLTIE